MMEVPCRHETELSDLEKEQIRERFAQGAARWQLSKEYNCSGHTVARLTKGIPQLPPAKPLSAHDRDRLLTSWTRPHVSEISS